MCDGNFREEYENQYPVNDPVFPEVPFHLDLNAMRTAPVSDRRSIALSRAEQKWKVSGLRALMRFSAAYPTGYVSIRSGRRRQASERVRAGSSSPTPLPFD